MKIVNNDKMKNFKVQLRCLLLFLSVFTFTNCSEDLDVKPKSTWLVDTYYKTNTEVELALNGVYGVFATDDVYGRSFMYMDYGTDEGYYTVTWN